MSDWTEWPTKTRAGGTRRRMRILVAVALLALACTPDPGKEPWEPESEPAQAATPAPRAPCADRDPLKRALFGDLHVHTGFSMDAWLQGTIVTPDDAYRFARGQEIGLPPYGEDGEPARRVRIERPLDFAAVTDHAEWLGELRLCRDSQSATA